MGHGEFRAMHPIAPFPFPHVRYYMRPAAILKYFGINTDVWNTRGGPACYFSMDLSTSQGPNNTDFLMQIKISMLV